MIPLSIEEKVDFLNQVGMKILQGDYTYVGSLCTILSQPTFKNISEKNSLFEKIVKLIIQSEQQLYSDNGHASMLLGIIYHLNISGIGNKNVAIYYYDKAIRKNNAIAMNNRALMHQYGLGGAVNYPEAIRLYEQAIALGQANAMSNRALMHQDGLGGAVNYPEAIRLLEQAMRCSTLITQHNFDKVITEATKLIDDLEFVISLRTSLWPDLLAGCRFTDQTLKLLNRHHYQIVSYFFRNVPESSTSLSFLTHLITTINHPLQQIIGIKELEEHHKKILQTRKTALMFFNRSNKADLKNQQGNLPCLPTELQHHILSFAQPGFIQDRSVGKIL